MTRIIYQTIRCPNCSRDIEARMTLSLPTFGVLAEDSDGRPIGGGIPPYDVDLTTCPTCGFTDSLEGFDGDLSPAERESLAALKISTADAPTLARRFQCAIARSASRDISCYERALLALSGSWQARQERDRVSECLLQSQALSLLAESDQRGEVSSSERNHVLYLRGELQRRLSGFHASRLAFEELLQQPLDAALRARVEELFAAARAANAENITWAVHAAD